MFWFTGLIQHSKIPSKQNKLPDKTGEKDVVSDLEIWAKKYPKIVSQEENKFKIIPNTFFSNYVVLFFTAIWRCFSQVFVHKKDIQPKQILLL